MPFAQGHALIIGVSKYQKNPYANVSVLASEARAVAQVILDNQRCGYPADQVELLLDTAATKAGILDALDRLAGRTAEKDTLFIYYAGHGSLGTDGNYQLVSNDAEFQSGRVVPGSGISVADLVTRLRAFKPQRALLFFNTCFSGSISPTLGPPGEKIESAGLSVDTSSALLATGKGRIIITACREDQSSHIGSGPVTIFGWALIEGLHGKGVGNSAGYISAYNLYEHIYRQVTRKVKSLNHVQEPELTIIKGVGPYPVALFKGASTLGEFDETQPPPENPAVQQIEPEDAHRSFSQVIQVRDGAVATGKGAIAIGKNARLIQKNITRKK